VIKYVRHFYLVFLFGLIFISNILVFAKSKSNYQYNQKKSVSYNEKQFLNNMRVNCASYGHKEIRPNDLSKNALETYPKELAFLYLKKHLKTFCYYSVSTLLKYLYDDFRDQTEFLVNKIVKMCVTDHKKYTICEGFKNESVLFDVTVILGRHCTKKTLVSFKKINCLYKEVVDKKCSLYSSVNNPLKVCPGFYTNKVSVKELSRSYFSANCPRRGWKPPKCLK
jgi:hypothetical protein